jgi:hypothetical protein
MGKLIAMTTTSITTTTAATPNTTAAADMLTGALGLAWDTIRQSTTVGDQIDLSEPYDNDLWCACARLHNAALALEAVVEEAAARLGVDMDDVLSLCSDRETAAQ